MGRPYYVIDAFASERYTGNPAAVVLDAEGLDDSAMRAIAAEFNLSETTFVLPPQKTQEIERGGPHVRFRWFTPTVEVDMCGHATIAGIHALLESGRIGREDARESTQVRIDTKSGTLTGYVENIPGQDSGRMIWLDLPDPVLTGHRLMASELSAVLRLPVDALETHLPTVETQDHDVLMFVRSVGSLNEARPDFPRLAELLNRERLRGLCLATVNTITPSVHVQSRFFAPNFGIDEDPVTGSVHGPLAAYLVWKQLVPIHDGLSGLTCVQGKPGGRTGLLHALVQVQGEDRFAVRIGGQAVTTMRGTLVD
jgi:trans-2,3-dihydro-3-hydroxyanthranilate isomerase